MPTNFALPDAMGRKMVNRQVEIDLDGVLVNPLELELECQASACYAGAVLTHALAISKRRLGLTQIGLAARLGVSPHTLFNWRGRGIKAGKLAASKSWGLIELLERIREAERGA